MTTDVVAELLVHCPTFTVTEYEPASAAVALLMTGFCKEEVNPLGPVQLELAPAMVDANKLIAPPAHTGELEPTTGAAGSGVVATMAV